MPNKTSTPLRITFLLPAGGIKPSGGFKVVYEYANYLAARGHAVHVVHPNILRIDEPLLSYRPKKILQTIVHYGLLTLTRRFRPDHWFTVNPSVRMSWVHDLSPSNVPDSDIVVATAWETAEWALAFPASKGRPFYLIQHLESWSGPEERVLATWRAPLEKIVIAKWLERIATSLGQSSHLIHNGMDFTRLSLTVPSDQRDPHRLLMLYHSVEWKGSADGLAAFALAKQSIPELKLTLFGIDPAPSNLPAGITYHHQPSPQLLNSLYNEAAIFISPSWTEGWGLPPAEALLCGAAIVVTEGGADEAFAIPDETALVSPIKDPSALAANILRLVEDKALRLRLASQGNALVQQFTWDRAGAALEAVLTTRAPALAPQTKPALEPARV